MLSSSFRGKRVLLFSAEHRITLALCRAFARKGYTVLLASPYMFPRSRFSRFCKAFIQYDPQHIDPLIEFIRCWDPLLILPVLDDSCLVAYALQDRRLPHLFPLPRQDFFTLSRDKFLMSRFLTKNNIASPETFSEDEFGVVCAMKDRFSDERFIIKPRTASGGRGVVYFEKVDNYRAALADYHRLICRQKFTCYDNVKPIVQQYVDGDDHSFNFVISKGVLSMKQCVHHSAYYPQPFGSPIRSRTVPGLAVIENALSALFLGMGWEGVVHCDVRINRQGRWWVNEVNPRFWGTVENTILSGIDIVDVLISSMATPGPTVSPRSYDFEYRYTWMGELAYLLRARHPLQALSFLFKKSDRTIARNIMWTDPLPHIVHGLRGILLREVI